MYAQLHTILSLYYLLHIFIHSYHGKNTQEQRATPSLIQWNRYIGLPKNTINNVSMVTFLSTRGFDKRTPATEKSMLPCFISMNAFKHQTHVSVLCLRACQIGVIHSTPV